MSSGAGNGKGHFQSHYIPNTPDEQAGMLAAIGVSSIDDLFADIPAEHRNPRLRLPDPLPELEIQRELGALAGRNRPLGSGPSFLGAGSYHHFIPAIVKSLVTRGEFITAYTPYQAEASQGTLQVIYEFQTLICNLYGMEVANAGMYEGATSLAEAALMACRVTRRERVAVLDTVSPAYRAVIEAYCLPQNLEVATVSDAASGLNDATACLVTQYPNFYGSIEDLGAQVDAAHSRRGAVGGVLRPHSRGDVPAAGPLRGRHRHRRGTAAGDSAQLRRAVRGAVRHQAGIHPADAEPPVRAAPWIATARRATC